MKKILVKALIVFSVTWFSFLNLESFGQTITSQPMDIATCEGNIAKFSLKAAESDLTYQWQQNSGSGFFNITDNSIFSGTQTPDLSIITSKPFDGFQYRCVLTSTSTSNTATTNTSSLTVFNPFAFVQYPFDTFACIGGSMRFVTQVKGNYPITYEWKRGSTSLKKSTLNSDKDTLFLNNITIADTALTTLTVTDQWCGVLTKSFKLIIPGPKITSPPQDQMVCSGSYTTLYVSATGNGTLSYQWQIDYGSGFTNIPGATTSPYSYGPLSYSDNNSKLRVIVSDNTVCQTTSSYATITVSSSTVITSLSTDQSLCTGAGLNLTVSASGPAPFIYNWKKNGTVVKSTSATTSTNDNFTVSNVGANDAGNYTVDVTTGCGPITSNPINVSVHGVTINKHPLDQTICDGGTPNFAVTATGVTGPLSYQWQVNKGSGFTDIVGGTAASYNNSASVTDNGNKYRVIIRDNGACPTTTNTANLIVNPPLTITSISSDQSLCVGQGFSLNVSATGGAPFSYNWYKGTQLVASTTNTGATSDTYSVASASTSDAGNYTVRITCACGVITSNPINVSVHGVTINNQPVSQTICENNGANFTVTATGATGPLSYQWQKSYAATFTDIAGATSSTFSLANVTTADTNSQYRVIIKDANACPVTSSTASLIVIPSTSIQSISSNKNLCIGTPLDLSVSVHGIPPFTYEWYKGTTLVQSTPNATSSSDSYQVSSVTLAGQGDYSVAITSGCGTLTSSPIKVSMTKPSITNQPSDLSICEGTTGKFNVTVDGQLGTVSYQWLRFNGNGTEVLTGETSSVLNVTGTTDLNGSSYQVVVAVNGVCHDTVIYSNQAILNIKTGAIVSYINPYQNYITGDPLTFSLSAYGLGTYNYSWQKDGQVVKTGSFNSSINDDFTIPSVVPQDSGLYVLSISGDCGTVHSNIHVTVTSFINQPSSLTTKEGDPVTISASTNLSPVTYQWQVSDGSSLKLAAGSGLVFTDLTKNSVYSNVDGPDLHISNASYTMNGNVYRCKITSSYGVEYSKEATLSVTKINAVNNSQELTNLSYYPNPATSSLFIQGIETTSTATIMDLSGKIQKSEVLQVGGNLSVEDLNDGMYILEIRNSSGTSRVPLVIKN